MHKTGWDAGVSSLHRIVCKVWTVRNRPVNWTPRKRETRDLRIEAPSSKRVQREGGSSSRVTYEGILTVTDRSKFVETLVTGIGREKVYGHGMLTIVPISKMIPDTTM